LIAALVCALLSPNQKLIQYSHDVGQYYSFGFPGCNYWRPEYQQSGDRQRFNYFIAWMMESWGQTVGEDEINQGTNYCLIDFARTYPNRPFRPVHVPKSFICLKWAYVLLSSNQFRTKEVSHIPSQKVDYAVVHASSGLFAGFLADVFTPYLHILFKPC